MEEKVKTLLEAALVENPSLFLISLTVSEQNQIAVVIDGDDGVKVEDCVAISRAIEHNLDREEQDFELQVYSAGVSQPLEHIRQYKKNVGRQLKVTTQENTNEGELVEATDNAITLRWKAREPKPIGKGKHTVQKEAVIDYTNIVEAKVMVKFN